MNEAPCDDNPGFVAKEPEHCSACFRLIRPGQTYYLTVENTVLCADCALVEGLIRVRGDLTVEVESDRQMIQRGRAQVEVFPSEIRHLVGALAEAGARLVSRDLVAARDFGDISTRAAQVLAWIQEARRECV